MDISPSIVLDKWTQNVVRANLIFSFKRLEKFDRLQGHGLLSDSKKWFEAQTQDENHCKKRRTNQLYRISSAERGNVIMTSQVPGSMRPLEIKQKCIGQSWRNRPIMGTFSCAMDDPIVEAIQTVLRARSWENAASWIQAQIAVIKAGQTPIRAFSTAPSIISQLRGSCSCHCCVENLAPVIDGWGKWIILQTLNQAMKNVVRVS